ncbi:hypothetical protein [Stieleria varia]|nr:hypothetical protein [Stieleria varia]
MSVAPAWAAQDGVPENASPPPSNVTVGIDGHYRVGRWTAVHVSGELAEPAGLAAGEDSSDQPLQVQTLDGDGIRVTYWSPEIKRDDADDAGGRFVYVVPGSEAAPLTVLRGAVRVETRFPQFGRPSKEPSMIPTEMPWVLALGDPLGIETIGANELLDRDPTVTVTIPSSARSLPDQSIGYDGVDWIVINRTGLPLLGDMSPTQQDALAEWIRLGGNVLLNLGGSLPQFQSTAPWLLDLLPLESDKVVRVDPSAVETWTTSQSRLEVFDAATLPRGRGRVLLSGRTTRRIPVTIAAEYAVGLGRAIVMAADLDDAPFTQWPSRMDLIYKLVGNDFRLKNESVRAGNRVTSYDDLAGQMRGALDQFDVKRSFGFSFLAIVLLALIAAIGPIDYFLVNRVLGKPLLGWLTFPLMAIGLSVVLITQAAPRHTNADSVDSSDGQSTTSRDSTQQQVSLNQVQIIDLNVVDQGGRAFTWSYLYSHDATRLRVLSGPSESLKKITRGIQWAQTAPFGHPGREFGGIQLAGENTLMPPYSVTPAFAAADSATKVDGLSLPPRGSKSIATRMSIRCEFPESLEMLRRPGSDQLRGELINPFPFDLLDGMLVYQNSVYLLPKRLQAGSRIASIDSVRQKSFRRQLTRQQSFEQNQTETEIWAPGDFRSPQRIAEILMFYQVAGGQVYTGLTDDPLSMLDLSHALVEDQCLLVGRTEEPLIETSAERVQTGGTDDVGPAVALTGETLSIIRLVVPVRVTRLD